MLRGGKGKRKQLLGGEGGHHVFMSLPSLDSDAQGMIHGVRSLRDVDTCIEHRASFALAMLHVRLVGGSQESLVDIEFAIDCRTY